jgi:hypothetical protein
MEFLAFAIGGASSAAEQREVAGGTGPVPTRAVTRKTAGTAFNLIDNMVFTILLERCISTRL